MNPCTKSVGTPKKTKVHQPGFEPGTFCVLSRRHNQLDHRCLLARRSIQISLDDVTTFIVSESRFLAYCYPELFGTQHV